MRSFFYMQRADRRTLLILLGVIVAAMAVFHLGGGDDGRPPQAQAGKQPADTIGQRPKRHYTYYQGKPARPALFSFDPNTADSTELLRLGLRPFQVVNIYKYRAAGGVYRRKSDFAKLYGLTVGEYRRLEPYIVIADDYRPASQYYGDHPSAVGRDTTERIVKLQPGEHVALNAADTARLRQVPGIGPYFARKIVEYGERLGGYYRVEQLLEIDDFPESSLPYFTIAADVPLRRMNVNRLSLNELKRHPYVSFYQARAIIEHRRTDGRINSLQQLSLLRDFTPEAIERLEPYVEY